MKLLVVEDDLEVRQYITRALEEAGHHVDALGDGDSALIEATHGAYDVLVVDRMLPGVDGVSLIRALRSMSVTTPTLILSALGEVDHRVEGLKAGSDDYLSKPFALSELLARVEALGRRQADTQDDRTLAYGGIEMDLMRRQVRSGGALVELLPKEFALLEYLLRHAEQVVTRTMLLEQVWQLSFDPKTNVVDVHISRLRQKLGDQAALVKTVRGAGYVLRE